MKRFTALLFCSCVVFSLAGCAPGDLLDKYINRSSDNTISESSTSDAATDSMGTTENTAQEASDTPKQRVYMDELKGTLLDFTGATLTMTSNEQTYTFDLAEATLECEDGMITGDEISVIYEGQLSNTDTSSVKALKVVDDFHKKNQLKTRQTYGQIQSLTPNTITIKNKKGKTATYPITGTEQYYQNGLQAGTWVYIYFKGKFTASSNTSSAASNASHLKVLSVSDIDPLTLPEPTPTPEPSQNSDAEAASEKQLHASIQNISTNKLSVMISGTDHLETVDISQIPSYFKGGIAIGSYVTLTYTGEYNGSSLEGITVTSVTGDDPDSLGSRNLTYTISGVIIGHTLNTVTIQTSDGAWLTCFTESAKNQASGNMEPGSSIRITFDPTQSKDSNIYTSLKIEDA